MVFVYPKKNPLSVLLIVYKILVKFFHINLLFILISDFIFTFVKKELEFLVNLWILCYNQRVNLLFHVGIEMSLIAFEAGCCLIIKAVVTEDSTKEFVWSDVDLAYWIKFCFIYYVHFLNWNWLTILWILIIF